MLWRTLAKCGLDQVFGMVQGVPWPRKRITAQFCCRGESFGVSQIARYKDRAHKKKLFKGEYITTVAHSIDDPYYYYIDEGQILTTFTDDSGEGAVVAWRSAGNAFSGEYNDFASIGKYKARHVAAKNTVLFVFSQRQL